MVWVDDIRSCNMFQRVIVIDDELMAVHNPYWSGVWRLESNTS